MNPQTTRIKSLIQVIDSQGKVTTDDENAAKNLEQEEVIESDRSHEATALIETIDLRGHSTFNKILKDVEQLQEEVGESEEHTGTDAKQEPT